MCVISGLRIRLVMMIDWREVLDFFAPIQMIVICHVIRSLCNTSDMLPDGRDARTRGSRRFQTQVVGDKVFIELTEED